MSLINGYNYVGGNPVNRVDPSGMQDCIPGFDCSVPGNGGVLTPNCTLFPNSPGCSGDDFSTIIIPPNIGDFDPDNLLNLCLCLNGGMCLQGCTYIFPGEYPLILLSGEEEKQTNGTAREGRRCGDSNWRIQIHSQNRPRPIGWRSHHGVLSAWMNSIFGRRYIADNAPTILMPEANHFKTYPIQNIFRTGIGGMWSDASWFSMFGLSDLMLDVANTPEDCQDEYWRLFKEFIKQLICQLATEALMYEVAQLTPTIIDMWNWADGSPDICEAMRWFTSV
jgi:hypothetical protein